MVDSSSHVFAIVLPFVLNVVLDTGLAITLALTAQLFYTFSDGILSRLSFLVDGGVYGIVTGVWIDSRAYPCVGVFFNREVKRFEYAAARQHHSVSVDGFEAGFAG